MPFFEYVLTLLQADQCLFVKAVFSHLGYVNWSEM